MKDLGLTTVYFGTFKMKQTVRVKYLGMVLHEDGIKASIRRTVEKCAGMIRGATFEVRSLGEDFRMAALGGSMWAGNCGRRL